MTLTRIFIDLESVSDELFRKARKFKGFFRPKLGDLQKKKKRLLQNPERLFGRNSKIFSEKKKVFSKIQSDVLAEIRNSKVFSAQN